MEDDEISIKDLIKEALEDCKDIELLDIIYKLLVSNQ